ncbi:Uncharacterized protein GBIM_10107, partial [Gryllus bimaculatus]
VDATAKLPEPLLGGLSLHLGDYDQCLRARSEAFAGRYCLVAAMGQRVATCVPSTCSWRSLDVLLANSSAGVVRVPSHTCQSADDPFVFHPATAALGVVVLLALLNALVWFLLTYEDVRLKLPARWRPSQKTAKALSPVTAWRKISGAPDPDKPRAAHARTPSPGAGCAGGAQAAAEAGGAGEARDPGDWSWALPRMSAASGLRTISMVWVVMGHRDALMPQLPVLDKRALPERMKQWAHVYVPAGLFAVDTFLFVAGCVLAYSFACSRRRHPRSLRQLRSWLPAFYLHRYIRLTPLMAFAIVLYAGGLAYFGEGPLWEQLSAFDVQSCRTNWWPNFLYIHNYYNNRNMPLAVLARLSFAVYLLHPTVQGVTGWSTRGTTVATDVTTIPLIVADVVLTFAVALPVSILVESPFIALESLLLRGGKTERRGSPPPPAPDSPEIQISGSIDPESPPQPLVQRRGRRASDSACLNVFGCCRDWLQSLRSKRRGRGSTSRSVSRSRSGSKCDPAEATQSRPYETLHSEESRGQLPSASVASLPVEQILTSEISLADEQPKPSELPLSGPSAVFPTCSSFVDSKSFFGSAVSSSSDESRQHPFVKGGSSETLWRAPSGEKIPMEDKALKEHTPVARSSSDESAKTPPVTRRSLENVEEEVSTDSV